MSCEGHHAVVVAICHRSWNLCGSKIIYADLLKYLSQNYVKLNLCDFSITAHHETHTAVYQTSTDKIRTHTYMCTTVDHMYKYWCFCKRLLWRGKVNHQWDLQKGRLLKCRAWFVTWTSPTPCFPLTSLHGCHNHCISNGGRFLAHVAALPASSISTYLITSSNSSSKSYMHTSWLATVKSFL